MKSYLDLLEAAIERRFDFLSLTNVRFLYMRTGKFIVGDPGAVTKSGLRGSHAEDYYDATGSNEGFDHCIRGWMSGKARGYRHGIIHFSPPVTLEHPRIVRCIQSFISNGAHAKTPVRGLNGCDGMGLGEIFPELFAKKKVVAEGESERVVYHVTQVRNLKRIMADGLKPAIGPRSRKIKETNAGIYFFPNIDLVLDGVENWMMNEFGEEAVLALLRVRLPADARVDSDVGFELRCYDAIPPENIAVLTRDVLGLTPEEIAAL